MNDDAGEAGLPVPSTEVLTDFLTRLYGRSPRGDNVEKLQGRIAQRMDAARFITGLARSQPYQANRQVGTHSPAGHYFSPVVDPAQVRDYYDAELRTTWQQLVDSGISIDIDAMRDFWAANRDFIAASPWSYDDDGRHRYYYNGGPYLAGDSNTLRAMIKHFRPRQIIEVGSGFSSAAMLDTAEELDLDTFRLTCIEPHPARLKGRMRGSDHARVEILERGVQGVDLARYDALEPGDICFIDSTHVLKTGSDVHYELFHILPRLKKGVIVHFHDCRFPFEYSERQVFEKNYSWNEAYGVRALLMHSSKFRILFWGSLFAEIEPDLVEATLPAYLDKPGSAIWIETIA